MSAPRRMVEVLRILGHNVLAHPIAGLLWAVGLNRAGDIVHSWCAPEESH